MNIAMAKNTVIYFSLVLFLGAVVYAVVTLSQGRTSFLGKASSPGAFVLEDCKVFAYPLITKASGSDRIRVTVFVLNGEGRGVPGKSITVNCSDPVICQNANVTFSTVQPITDNFGQAAVDVSSTVAGKYDLQASVTGLAVPQTVKVIFQ